MILALKLAPLGAQMERAFVHRVCVAPGDAVRPGSALFELRVDLGAGALQDCPPLFYFRLVATERAVVREVLATAGALLELGAPLATLSTSADEPLGAPAARGLRCTGIAIQVDALAD